MSKYIPLFPEYVTAAAVTAMITPPKPTDSWWNARSQQDAKIRHYWAMQDVQAAPMLISWTTDPIAKAVMQIHAPISDGYYVTCGGCEFSGYEADPPEWPCQTWAAVEALLLGGNS